jgi:acyl transferase domain-containing protein
MLSTVTGRWSDGSDFDADYWMRNLREPVLFWDAVQTLIARDNGVFVEMSPHPLLLSAVEQGFEFSEREGLALPAMRRDEPETHGMLENLGALHTHGVPVSLDQSAPTGARPGPLPGYTWQHERFWFRDPGGRRSAVVTERAAVRPPEPAQQQSASEQSGPAAELLDRLAPAAGTERRDLAVEFVRSAVADILEMVPERIDPDAGFFQMGMDSMLAARVRVRLEAGFGRKLPAPIMFEHPSVGALSAHLLGLAERLLGEPAGAPDPDPTPPLLNAARGAGAPTHVPTILPAPGSMDDLPEEELLALLAEEVRASTRTAGGSR